jgi:DNA polymerase
MTNNKKEWRATLDFESRSACSLRRSGSWKYSLDPTTEILCLAFRLPYWKKDRVALWHPAFPAFKIRESRTDELCELFNWILSGELVEAHNAFFEKGLWTNIAVPKFGWPAVQSQQWRCSAAKAAAHALPRGLDDVAKALGLGLCKDEAGTKVMMKMNKPRKPRKQELADWLLSHTKKQKMPPLYHESRELLEQLWKYCQQDVLVEEAVSNALNDLSPAETDMYLLDQTLNERGFQLDMVGVSTALSLIGSESKRLNGELSTLTGGSPDKATKRTKMQQWFADQWYVLEDTKGPTIDAALKEDNLDPKVRRGLELIQALSRSSTAKYEAMRNWACPDGRVRGGLLYHGASTGRWSGAGVQPHNFPKGKVRDIEGAWAVLKTQNLDTIRAFKYDGKEPVNDVLKLLSQSLRGAIVASPGKKLFVADYAAIEARVLFWVAEDEDALEIFRRGEDIYCDMASSIYGRTIVTNPDKQPPERALGKIAVLGLGYQMGAPKFTATCANFGIPITEALAEQTVTAYRAKFSRVKELWYAQEGVACEAVRNPGKAFRCGCVSWKKEGDFLYCTLPSSRKLAYPFAAIRPVTTSWGAQKMALTYWGVDALSRKWKRQSSYGGMLVENIVQAISRDVMALAILRCEESRVYQPILSVHDEVICEANQHLGSVAEYTKLVASCPDWATGLPVEVEAWSGTRYRK